MPQVSPTLNPQGRTAAAWFEWTDAGGYNHRFFFDVVESEDWTEGATVTEHPVEVGFNITDNVRVQLVKCTLKVFATNEPIAQNQWTDLGDNTEILNWSILSIQNPQQVLIVPEWESNIAARALIGFGGGILGSVLGGSVGGGLGSLVAIELAETLLPGTTVLAGVPVNAGLIMNRVGGASAGQAITQLRSVTSPDDFVARTIQTLEGLKNAAQLCTVHGTKAAAVPNMVIEGLDHHRGNDTGTGAEITLRFKEIRIVASTTVAAPSPQVPRATPPTSNGNQNTTATTSPKASAALTAGRAIAAALSGSGSPTP